MDEIETNDGAEDIVEEIEDTEEAEVEAPELEEPKAEKPKETPEQAKARLERQLARINKKLGADEPKKAESKAPSKTDGLDDNALDFLDIKGVSEAEDIKVIETIVKKTGMTVREALKDEYVVAKLEANKKARDVKNATPSGSKRATATSGSLEAALAEFERTQKLPDDFELQSKVIDAFTAKSGANKPNWHK